ncbi:glycoside hydrolase family 115 protein [Hortaea werneckii]|nr:glycoside hydrolase family 115 protein [Hortaea werneckii]KAI7014642.1 glycoside hydrolase family 115 protein [Hortaea werneckii]KAI7182074.1 glycoside hydrolase family 115 protein [Hortaea werneckii]KAI7581611.1 glycoside hydrolase family 115 protein [Hortaea werneckii]KAI7667684.1 glycoside hydrolase family 115 protein [Hortaea werneckii]
MFETDIVQFRATDDDCVCLNDACIIVTIDDCPGIKNAAHNLSNDLGTVLNQAPTAISETALDDLPATKTAIIVGNIESSPTLQRLAENGKIDIKSLQGKWESFMTSVVRDPFDGIQHALVIAGSDKRGAIYGVYTLSEQIGVSPWHWWADVSPRRRDAVFAPYQTTQHGEPSVKYRGIFLNDEAPSLTGWVLEKFGKYNSQFYEKVFELLLRLKANYMWPAMWPGYPNPGASFFTDDPLNQRLADEMGIVVSTSHHEPMQRLSNEWFAENPEGSWNWLTNKEKIIDFFRAGAQRAKAFESCFTLGMRGEYDKKMAGDDPAFVVEDVIKAQRELLRETYGRADAVPLQALFESGRLNVPEDVTLLFGDDNFGTIRRLPTAEEAKRKGEAGIYYHLEYVGWPRSYKWINSNSLGKIRHQLLQAYNRKANQIWIFNVGDLKPLECPLSFAMAMAWDCNTVANLGVKTFLDEWAAQNFHPDVAEDASSVLAGYDRIASLRKHELIEPGTFSVLHHREADTILGRLQSLLDLATRVYGRVSKEDQASVFELILHPVKATHLFVNLQVTRSRNRLYARQRRNSANRLAKEILDLFDADFDLSEEYHTLLGGKWHHMLRQPHLGYGETWHAPSRDMIDGICYVQRRQPSNPIVGQMGVTIEGHEGVRPGRINEESERTHPSRRDLLPGVTFGCINRYGPASRWFEIFTRGPITVDWQISTSAKFIKVSSYSGRLVPGEPDARVEVSIDWTQVPPDMHGEAQIDIRSQEGDYEQLHLPFIGDVVPSEVTGVFVESSSYVSIPATGCTITPPYEIMPNTGRLDTGSVTLQPSAGRDGDTSCLCYPFYTFSTTSSAVLTLYFGMTLALAPDEVPTYDLFIDDKAVSTHPLYTVSPAAIAKSKEDGWPAADGWFNAVCDNVWMNRHPIEQSLLTPGYHKVSIRLRHSNILLEKMVIELESLGESYLGPPPSHYIASKR